MAILPRPNPNDPPEPPPGEDYDEPGLVMPEANYAPGWPSVLSDTSGNEFVRIRDGSTTGPYAGNSALYAQVCPHPVSGPEDSPRQVSQQAQFVPLRWSPVMDPYTVPELDITFSAGAWTTDEQFAAAGCPGLAPLPEGYVYANQSTEAQPQPQPT